MNASKPPAIAIIGAGIAGLTAAHHLVKAGITPTIFDKSRGLSGRAATRWFDRPAGRVYVDHGAQYLREEGETLPELFRMLPDHELVDIGRPVWIFDQHNHIAAGDPDRNAGRKLTYQHGVASLGGLIARYAGLTVQQETRIERLEYDEDTKGYTLYDAAQQNRGTFDQVIVAIPSVQAIDLVTASTLTQADPLIAALGQAQYRRCLTVVLGFDRPLAERPFYALVNTDKQHAISWIGLEHLKPGHAPLNHSVVVAQMAGAYSLTHYEDEKTAIIADVAQQVSVLLDEDLTAPDFTDCQKWKFSQPDVLADSGLLNSIVPGLYFCGDYLKGGRVHLAADSGAEIAAMIIRDSGS